MGDVDSYNFPKWQGIKPSKITHTKGELCLCVNNLEQNDAEEGDSGANIEGPNVTVTMLTMLLHIILSHTYSLTAWVMTSRLTISL